MSKPVPDVHHIAGVLAVRQDPDSPRIALVTSSDGSMWVIPKGHIEPGESAPFAAAREAMEEAGIAGRISPATITSYGYDWKNRRYEVSVFLMRVEEIAPTWPEADRRERRWFTPAEAREVVVVPELVEEIDRLEAAGQ